MLRVIATALGLLMPGISAAQEERGPAVHIGVSVAQELGLTSARFPIRAGSPGCGEFTSGISSGSWYGGSITIPTLFSPRIGASARLGWLHSQQQFMGDVADPLWVFDPKGRTEVRLDREFRYTVTFTSAIVDLLASYRVADGLSLAAGPRIGYRTASAPVQSDHIINGGDLGFENGGDTREMTGGERFTTQPLVLGGTLAGWYAVRLSPRLSLVTELSAAAQLLSSVHEVAWRDFTLRGGFALVVNLSPPTTPDATVALLPPGMAPPQPIARDMRSEKSQQDALEAGYADTVMTAAGLGASIKLYSIDEHGNKASTATVYVVETVRREVMELDRHVAFEEDAVRPSTLVLLGSRLETLRFTADSLSDVEIPEHLLNIIGERLRNNPQATIALDASASTALAEQRQKMITRYFTEIWGIAPARIIATAEKATALSRENRPDQGQAGGQVVISSDYPQIIAPVRSSRTDRDFISPRLKLEPLYQSDTGVKRWNLLLDHHGQTIAQYSSEGAEEQGKEADDNWQPVYERLTSDSTFITATFTVEDLADEQATVQSRIPLRLQRSQRIIERNLRLHAHQEELVYVFSAADSASSDLLRPESDIITEMARSADRGSTVSIIGIAGGSIDEHSMRVRTAHLAETLRTALAQQKGNRKTVGLSQSVLADTTTRTFAGEHAPGGSMVVLISRKR